MKKLMALFFACVMASNGHAQLADSTNIGQIQMRPTQSLIHYVKRGETFTFYYWVMCANPWLNITEIYPQVWLVSNNSQTDMNVVCHQ